MKAEMLATEFFNPSPAQYTRFCTDFRSKRPILRDIPGFYPFRGVRPGGLRGGLRGGLPTPLRGRLRGGLSRGLSPRLSTPLRGGLRGRLSSGLRGGLRGGLSTGLSPPLRGGLSTPPLGWSRFRSLQATVRRDSKVRSAVSRGSELSLDHLVTRPLDHLPLGRFRASGLCSCLSWRHALSVRRNAANPPPRCSEPNWQRAESAPAAECL